MFILLKQKYDPLSYFSQHFVRRHHLQALLWFKLPPSFVFFYHVLTFKRDQNRIKYFLCVIVCSILFSPKQTIKNYGGTERSEMTAGPIGRRLEDIGDGSRAEEESLQTRFHFPSFMAFFSSSISVGSQENIKIHIIQVKHLRFTVKTPRLQK